MGIYVKIGGSTMTGGGVGPSLPGLPHPLLGVPVLSRGFASGEAQPRVFVTIPITWPDDDPEQVDRLFVYLQAPVTAVDTQPAFTGGPDEVDGILEGDAASASKFVELSAVEQVGEQPWDPEQPMVSFSHPEPTKEQTWRAIVVSGNKEQHNRIEDSPSVDFAVVPGGGDVKGVEYAPNALNFRMIDPATGETVNTVRYENTEGGNWTWGTTFAWSNNENDPRYPALGGYDLDIEYEDGRIETAASMSRTQTRYDTAMWPMGAPSTIRFWLVPYSNIGGNPKNTRVFGVTASLSVVVRKPTGSAGNENAPLVKNFRMENPYYERNGAGQPVLFIPWAWDYPDEMINYGGAIVKFVRLGKTYTMTGIETDRGEVSIVENIPKEPEEGCFAYCLSVNKALEPNTYVPGTTPEIAVFTLHPPQNTTPPVTAFNASIFYAKDEFGANTYGISGSWINPTKALNPEYQGVKVYAANADGTDARALTGVEPKQTFKTDMWPVVPGFIYLFAVSVDVNGNEAALVLSPRVGPLFIVAQGGTLNKGNLPAIANEDLPDINIANFASGIEPIAMVGGTDTGNGILTGVAFITNTVYSTISDKMYRWEIDKYKQVGGIGDISALSVTSVHLAANSAILGKVAAGAIRTTELAGNEILVGPSVAAPDKPPRLIVQTTGGQMLGMFGSYSGWEGIYALNLRVGPSFASPTIEATASGVTISNARLTVSNGAASAINVGPTYFDPTYSVLSLQASDNIGSTTHLMSRGIAVYGSGGSVASLNRQPSNHAGEMILYNSSGILTVNINGQTGNIRGYTFQSFGELGITGDHGYTTSAGIPAVMKIRGGIIVDM